MKTQKAVPLLFAAWLAGCGPGIASEPILTSESDDLALNDRHTAPEQNVFPASRPYQLRVPSGYDGATPAPLLVVLHGYGGNGELVDWYFKLGPLADIHTFFIASPNGNRDSRWLRHWNASKACCDFDGKDTDDVAYFNALVDDVSSRFQVDARRIFVVGHSNGGFMAHRLACEPNSKVAALVSLAGAGPYQASDCEPSHPVAVLQIHGEADQTISYLGGQVDGMTERYPSSLQTVSDWAKRMSCSASPVRTGRTLDLERRLGGNETFVERFEHCPAGAVERWTLRGGRHTPALRASFASAVYEFLSAHPLPSPP